MKSDVRAFEAAALSRMSFAVGELPDAQQAIQIAENVLIAAAVAQLTGIAVMVEKVIASVLLNLAEGNRIAGGIAAA